MRESGLVGREEHIRGDGFWTHSIRRNRYRTGLQSALRDSNKRIAVRFSLQTIRVCNYWQPRSIPRSRPGSKQSQAQEKGSWPLSSRTFTLRGRHSTRSSNAPALLAVPAVTTSPSSNSNSSRSRQWAGARTSSRRGCHTPGQQNLGQRHGDGCTCGGEASSFLTCDCVFGLCQHLGAHGVPPRDIHGGSWKSYL